MSHTTALHFGLALNPAQTPGPKDPAGLAAPNSREAEGRRPQCTPDFRSGEGAPSFSREQNILAIEFKGLKNLCDATDESCTQVVSIPCWGGSQQNSLV
ncbi:hypothetical protein CapIbe_008395 [Capra ibex]